MKLYLAAISLFALSASAFADCSIKNDTPHDFTVTNGNVSNRSFGSNNIQSFAKGPVVGKTSDGKSFSLTCSGSEGYIVKVESGAIVAKPK